MSSDRLGKYREKPSRSRTPYSRPKGLIRRVTDSVSGLLGGSWIPGFLRNEEEEVHLREKSDTANSALSRNAEHNHHQEPGPSGCSRPVTSTHQLSPRSLAALYPEEAGESDITVGVGGLDSQQHSNTLAAADRNSTGSAIRHNFSTASFSMGNSGSSSAAISSDAPQIDSSGNSEERNLGATFSESTFREKYPGEHRVHYSGLHSSQTHVKTSLYNDVSSLHFSSAGPLQPFSFQQQTTSVASAAHTSFSQQDSTAPTPKTSAVGGQKLTPDLSRSVDSVSTPSARLSAAQSSSKRPRFSLAAYSAAATPVGNKSILSDGSFRSSPFYPGRTIYGGASAYRRTPTPVTPNRSATASPRIGAATADAGLSDAAQRILCCLNSLSTPLTDAKRIPTPSASPYTSYLDSPYTAAFHKHRPNRPPPTALLSTPTKVGIQSNLSQYVFPSRGPSCQQQQSPSVQSSSKKPGNDFLDPAASSSSSTVQQPSIFSVAAASSSRSASSVAASPAKPISSGNNSTTQQQSLPRNHSSSSSNPLLQPSKPFCFDITESNDDNTATAGVTSTRSLRLPTVPEDNPPQSSVFSFTNTLERTDCGGGGGGKIKSDKKNSHLVSTRYAELQRSCFSPVTASALPKASLPNIVFTSPIPLAGPAASSVSRSATTSAEQPCSSQLDAPCDKGRSGKESSLHGFKFSVPEVVVKEREYTTEAGTTSQFSFSAPASVLMDDNTSASDNFVAPQPSSFVPKLKQTSPVQNKTLDSTRELISKPGGLLEFLSKTSNKGASECSKNISSDSVTNVSSISSGVSSSSYCSEPVQSGFGDKFKAAAGSWECNECLVRNKVEAVKCIACQMPKPGLSSANTAAVSFGSIPSTVVSSKEKDNSSGFGNLFKKSSNEWDCTSCLLRNKDTSDECVACKSAKPGNKISSTLPLSESSKFSFGVKPQSGNVNNSTSFGMLQSSTSSVDSKPTSSTSGGTTTFVFGVKTAPVSSSGGFTSSSSSSSVVASSFTGTTITSTAASKDTLLGASENKGFGAAFKKASGDWDCSSCLLINKSSDNKCVACASIKPGCNAPSNDSNSFCKFDNLVPAVGFGDKFKKAAGDWECESCLVTNKAALVKCAACDSPKPGSLDNSKILTGNFKFNSASKSPENASFKFGVASAGLSTDVKVPTPSAGFTFGAPVTSANSLSATACSQIPKSTAMANFTFGVAPVTSSNGGFNFGSAMDSTKKTVVDTNAAASNVTTNFSYVPPLNSSPTLKTTSVESTPKSIELKTGSVLDVLKNSSDKSKTDELTDTSQPVKTVFGGSVFEKAANSGSTAPLFNSLNTNSLSKPTFNFGSSESAIFKTNNLIQNSACTMNSFETVSKTSNKRSLGVDDDCSGSANCKKSGSPFVKNNGIAEPGSLFNIGKSDSQAGSTGSTAPPPFTFGQCAAPAAKTATAFGGDVPAFGSAVSGFANNNNNTINDTTKSASKLFAFGQPSERKPSASFDFGQAAPNFNFSTSTAPSTFQFAQNSGSSAGNNGIFQFASGGSASTPSAVTPGFGDPGSNPFSQAPTATPSGRVMKKAIRRNKK